MPKAAQTPAKSTSPQAQQVVTKPVQQQAQEEHLMHDFKSMKKNNVTVSLPLIIIAVAIIFSGGITGYVLAQNNGGGLIGGGDTGKQISEGGTTEDGVAKIVGVKDEDTFSDTVEGVLKEGGVEGGVGTHHLEREGGPSQTVYLTSSTIALDDYMDKTVKVSGETNAAENAGWFMDVGRLEVLE